MVSPHPQSAERPRPRHVKLKVLLSCLAVKKLEEKSNTSYMINKIY